MRSSNQAAPSNLEVMQLCHANLQKHPHVLKQSGGEKFQEAGRAMHLLVLLVDFVVDHTHLVCLFTSHVCDRCRQVNPISVQSETRTLTLIHLLNPYTLYPIPYTVHPILIYLQ